MSFLKRTLKNLTGMGAKFAKGDTVAVSCPRGETLSTWAIYPKTVVMDRRYYDGEERINNNGTTGCPIQGWWYEVMHEQGTLFHEKYIRPYNDDDYKVEREVRRRQRVTE